MNTTIINDCKDANAVGRQSARVASLIPGNVSFVGVDSDLEAAGNLVDLLDAYGDKRGVILVNIAPRDGAAKKWKNGTPFGYFWYKNVLVVSSIDGYTLSLVKKLDMATCINVLDIPTATKYLVSKNLLSPELRERIVGTQFRSYDFLPRIAAHILTDSHMPSEKQSLNDIPDAPDAIWWVDNFGNCKTTLLARDLKGRSLTHATLGDVPHIPRLADVSDGATALVTGSSGIEELRFLEIVTQGASSAARHTLASGDALTHSPA